jgi:Icc-related predicted phosphoesterase
MKSLKCIAISDSHSHDLTKVLAGFTADILFIAGDWSYKATFQEVANFKQELKDIRPQFREIVWINGNHELGMEQYPHLDKEITDYTDTRYLEDSGCSIRREIESGYNSGEVVTTDQYVKVWGSPATPWFGGWAYNYQRGPEIARVWENIPEGLDILMTHGPINGINDMLPWSGEQVGCLDLRNKLNELQRPPRVHLSGHLHVNYSGGVPTKFLTDSGNVVDCYNVAICTEQYKATNQPTEFYI